MPDIKNMEVVQENSCDIYSDGTVFNGYDTDSADALYVKKLRAEGQNLDSGMFALQPISNSVIGNFFRGGAESVTNIVAQAGNNAAIAYRTIMDAYGEHFKTLTDEELKFNKQIVENLRIQNQEIADSIHEFFGAEDESLAAKIGSGVVQSAASIGFNAIGASPLMIAMFGVNTAGEVMAKSRETGRSAVESLARGTGAGLAEAKLESWGLQNLVENITANTVRKAATKSFVTEFIEEASQSLSTAFFSYGLDNRDIKTYITNSLKDAFEEGVYGGISGGITGGAGAGIRRLANGGFKNSMIDSMQKKLGRTLNKKEVEAIDKVVNRGEVSMEKAVEDSVKTLNNADEMRQAIQDTINEQIDRTKYGNDFNYSNISGRAKEIMDEILAGKRQMEENNHVAVVDLVSSNSNLNQENKDRTIAMMEAFLAANEETFGVSVTDQLKDFTNMKIRSESEAVSQPQEETYLNEAGELVDKTSGNVLFQSAYAGSRVDYDRPSLEAIGSGEGNQAHGYGLYYALNKDVAESYRETFTNENKQIPYTVLGDKTLVEYIKENGKQKAKEVIQNKINESEMKIKAYEDIGDNFTAQIWQGHRDELQTLLKATDTEGKGQVHEVDIPEMPYLMDEQKLYSQQSDFVKNAIDNAYNSLTDLQKKMFKDKTDVKDYKKTTGKKIYQGIAYALYNTSENGENGSKLTSELLNKQGIKGITYEGQEDGRCFVIFNPEDVKVLRKKFDELGNVFFQKEQEIRGQVDVAKKLVDVFKTGNRDTVVHELNHLFSIYKINLAINNNKLDTLAPLFKHFGLEQTIENAEKLKNETYYQEELAKMSINYIAQHEAPNVALRKYFQEFKQWAQSVWENLVNKGLVQKEELSQDIVDFFDSMYSTKEVDVEKAKNELKDLIKQIKSGKAINIDNINIDEVYKLLDAKYRRIPKAPKNLKQRLIAEGGIDNQLAENFDLKELMGEKDNKYSRLFKKEGKIKDENQLIEFLKNEKFMTMEDAETDVDAGNELDRALNLLEDAENVYSENDIEALIQRENTIAAVTEAEQILDTLDIDGEEVKQYISELKKNDIVAVSKSEVKELNNKIKNLEKEYKKLSKEKVKEAVDNIKEYRNKIIDFIKSQSIDSDDKAKLITEIKKANTELSLKKTMERVKERAQNYYTQEQVRLLSGLIDKEVKKSKPTEVKKQRYDYENNKLFKALREDSKLTQVQAEEKWRTMTTEENGETSHIKEIEKLYLAYKMNGAKSSPQLLNFLLSEIQNAKELGRRAKDDMELERKLELKDNKNEILGKVNDRKVANKFENKLAVILNNLHSMLNLVAGKDVADKFQMETVENNMVIHKTKILEDNLHTAQDIYKYKSKGDFLNRIAEMRKVITQLKTDPKTGLNLSYDITKMQIIDLFNDAQNSKVWEDLKYYYGEDQMKNLFSLLTTQDIEFANSMRETADSMYPEINQVYVEQYGIDLNKTENYWMLSTEHQKDSDLLADFSRVGNTPSFFEERTKSRVLVVPKDAYSKFRQHIAGACYMTDMAREWKNLRDTFNSVRIKNAIQNKFGNEVWNNVNAQINRLSYGEYMKGTQQDEVSTILSRMVNNFITAKIAIAPSVFVKQLTSATNYAENMGYGAWGKGFVEGISHPKETINYMYKYAGDFLRTRSQLGYDEAMSRITQQVQQAKKTVFTPKMQNNYTEVMSFMTKQGDITAIIFGGYPRLKQMIDSGMPTEEAVKQFQFETLRGQQSGMTSSLSNFQNNRNAFVRLMFAFKNTPQQYLRKINDTVVSAINGDIDLQTASRKLFNYAIVQPTLYVLAGTLVYNTFSPDDKDKEWTDGILSQLAFQFLDPIPFIDKVAREGYKKLTGQYSGEGMPVVGYDDLMKSFKKMAKSDKTDFDYAEIFVPFIEMFTGAPAGRVVKNLKTLAE